MSQISFSPLVNWQFDTSTSDLEPATVYQYPPDAAPESPPPASATKPRRSGSHIPRPRNAFMLFRSQFSSSSSPIPRSLEHDNRHISRIIGFFWRRLPESEKDVWRARAAQEKARHARVYPGYRFDPAPRKKKSAKRKVKRNGEEELVRCEQVAQLLLEGKKGDELTVALARLNSNKVPKADPTPASETVESTTALPESIVDRDPSPDAMEVSSLLDPLHLPADLLSCTNLQVRTEHVPPVSVYPYSIQYCRTHPPINQPVSPLTPVTPLEQDMNMFTSVDIPAYEPSYTQYDLGHYYQTSVAYSLQLPTDTTSILPTLQSFCGAGDVYQISTTSPLSSTHYYENRMSSPLSDYHVRITDPYQFNQSNTTTSSSVVNHTSGLLDLPYWCEPSGTDFACF